MRVRILGIGMGPQHVTPEVAEALAGVDYVLAADRGTDGGRLALRRAVVDAYAPTVPIVTIADPPRDRSQDPSGAAWRTERGARYTAVLRERGGVAAFLVWGDPALYDSTIRIVGQAKAAGVVLDYDILPGISAPQLLAARHLIVLHEVGAPVHITTGRRLAEAVAAGQRNIVAMLNPPFDLLDLSGLDDWTIWWGANLGAVGERLVSGRVGDVLAEIGTARAAAEAEAGWVMDVFLVRCA